MTLSKLSAIFLRNRKLMILKEGKDMFQKNEFRAALARNNMTLDDVAKALEITPPTVSRKINGQGDFFRYEIEKLCQLLNLTPEETLKIFFAV